MRDFRAATHCHCPRREPGQISCRPEPGGLYTACDNWLHSLKSPRVSQMISVNQEPLVLTGLPEWHWNGSPTSPLPCPRFCIESQSPAQAHRVFLGAGKGSVGLSWLPGVPKVLIFLQLPLHNSLMCWGANKQGLSSVKSYLCPKLNANHVGPRFFPRPRWIPHKEAPWAGRRMKSLSFWSPQHQLLRLIIYSEVSLHPVFVCVLPFTTPFPGHVIIPSASLLCIETESKVGMCSIDMFQTSLWLQNGTQRFCEVSH